MTHWREHFEEYSKKLEIISYPVLGKDKEPFDKKYEFSRFL